MPDATTLGFPFPLGAEPVAAGATNIEDLAEFIDTFLTPSRFADNYTNLGQDIANTGVDIVVGWNVAGHTLTSDWTWSTANNRWTYSGPNALFLVVCQLVFNVAAAGGTIGAFLRADAAIPVGGVSSPQDAVLDSRLALNFSALVPMGPAYYDTLDVRARSQLSAPSANAAIDGGDYGGNRIQGVRLRGL